MVKRYKNTMHMFAGEYGDSLDEHPEGDWVEYEYYAALEAKCRELGMAGDMLAHELLHKEHPAILDQWWKVRGHDNCVVCHATTTL